MDNNAFTGGISPGGLTTDYEIRMLICWLLQKIDQPITMSQFNYGLQQHGLVNYFELADAISKLLASGHIVEKEVGEGKEKPVYHTEIGTQTANTFETTIPFLVREKALSSMKETLLIEILEKENKATLEEIEGGYMLHIAISDIGTNLLELSIYVPTKEMGEKMKKSFISDPTQIYRAAIKSLSGETIEGGCLRE